MGSDPLLQLRRIGLDPAEEGCVVDRDTAVLQHQLEIAVADREHQVPSDRPQDYLGRELPALERLALRHNTRAAIRLVETARLSNPDPPHKLATDPNFATSLPDLRAKPYRRGLVHKSDGGRGAVVGRAFRRRAATPASRAGSSG